MKNETLGSHWKNTEFSGLYQLYRRVESVAAELEKRRRDDHVASRPYIEELNDIAIDLKILGKKR